jgi:hypothetical protein
VLSPSGTGVEGETGSELRKAGGSKDGTEAISELGTWLIDNAPWGAVLVSGGVETKTARPARSFFSLYSCRDRARGLIYHLSISYCAPNILFSNLLNPRVSSGKACSSGFLRKKACAADVGN